jgi:ATP-dependent RNA helicase DDX31/DBP7
VSVFNRKDSIIKAATGSGKTLAYLVPLINQTVIRKFVTKREDGTSILVVCPTRELCMQAQK